MLAGLLVPVAVHWVTVLRWAHLYRQRTHEGLAFAYAGLELVLISLVAAGVVVAQWRASERDPGRARQHHALAWSVAVGVGGLWLVAFWIEGHGSRCVLGC